ncbi:MAG: anti-sigma factor domain-containing protein, partial [Bacillota bacterium]
MNKDTGMVVEIKGKTCIILTPGGEFREVALPSGNVRLGDEITSAAPAKIPAWWKPLLAAAGVFLLLWAGFLYSGWSNEAVAYVGLDINPSVELGLNRRQLVCQAGSLDAEGAALLQKAAVRGLPLEKAIAALLAEAVTARYLDPARENVVLTTVTAAKDEKREMPAEQQISRYIENALRASGAGAEVVVVEAPPQVRRQAQEAGLSTGKYLLYLRGAQ